MENTPWRGRILLACLCAITAFSAIAQDVPTQEAPTQEILAKKCRAIAHQPRADVDYKPGTTAGGWVTKSPNLHEPLTINPNDIKIPLNVPIKGYVTPGTHNVDLSQTNANIGTLTLQGDQLLLDGKALNAEDPRLNTLCDTTKP